jgi:hypothetical protein
MSNNAYERLAQVLDTLPNGFPATEDGLEISLLKRIFTDSKARRDDRYTSHRRD